MSSQENMFLTIERGALNSVGFRMFMLDENGPISAMHDIPLYPNGDNNVYNVVVLGPRWTNGKYQITTKESLNPIRQESRNGILRYVANCFPHHGYIWNYCVLPQTWKSSELINDGTGIKGNNKPMEVLEIGSRVANLGEVLQVKILGTVALRNETGWRIVAIDINDPLASEVNDISDVVNHFPGLMKATLEWYKITRVPDGKSANCANIAGDIRGTAYAQNIVKQFNMFWRRLVMNEVNPRSISCLNTSVIDSPYKIHSPDATVIIDQAPPYSPPVPVEDIIDKWHYIQFN
ncbi:hypothetical protein Trydic_g11967 [Trypoxylus dichotomus]